MMEIRTIEDLLKILETHSEWRDALRRLLFPEAWSIFATMERLEQTLAQLAEERKEDRALLRELEKTVARIAAAHEATQAEIRALTEAQKRAEARLDRLEQTVAELAEAQKQTQAEIRALAEAQKRTEERVDRLEQVVAELAEAQRRTEERLDRLEQVVAELAEAQKQTQAEIRALAEAQKRTEERLERLERVVAELAEAQKRIEARVEHLEQRMEKVEHRLHRVEVRLGRVEGKLAEYDFRDKAPAYLGTHGFRRVRSLSPAEWVKILDEAEESGRISDIERRQGLLVDAVVRGRYQDREAVIVVEISVTVEEKDVLRIQERAQIWQKALPDVQVLPLVAGEHIAPEAWERAKREQVLVLLDGDMRELHPISES